MGAEVLAVVTGLIAIDEIESAGFTGKTGEGKHRSVGGMGVHLGLVRDLIREGLPFHKPYTCAPPAGDNHHLDKIYLDWAGRAEFFKNFGDEVLEVFDVFAGQENAFTEQSVFDGVAGGGKFALLGDGPTGFAAVGARGLDLKIGSHNLRFCYRTGWVGDWLRKMEFC